MSQIPETARAEPCCAELARWAERLAFIAACVAVAGSLSLTLGLHLIACPLCLYQRLFAMSVVAVLLSGWLFVQGSGRGSAVLAFPLSIGGLTVALFHASKEWQEVMVCPLGLFNLGTAPQQSAAIFAIVTALLLVSIMSGAAREVLLTRGVPAVVILAGMGIAMAYGMIKTGPPPAGSGSLGELLENRDKNQLTMCTPVKPDTKPVSTENTQSQTDTDSTRKDLTPARD